MNTRLLHLLVATAIAMPVVGASVALAATPAEDVGASGQCYDSDSPDSGGQAAIDVSNGQVSPSPTDTGAVESTVTGAVAAAVTFASNPKGAIAGNSCTSNGPDHLEAHAFVDGVGGAQVCYDGQPETVSTAAGPVALPVHVYYALVCVNGAP
jgi:hypothetical protein